jgi:hypothetical protein
MLDERVRSIGQQCDTRSEQCDTLVDPVRSFVDECDKPGRRGDLVTESPPRRVALGAKGVAPAHVNAPPRGAVARGVAETAATTDRGRGPAATLTPSSHPIAPKLELIPTRSAARDKRSGSPPPTDIPVAEVAALPRLPKPAHSRINHLRWHWPCSLAPPTEVSPWRLSTSGDGDDP